MLATKLVPVDTEAESVSAINVQTLIARRQVEIAYFIEALGMEAVLEDIDNSEYFKSLIALAVNDYGVSRAALAEHLHTDQSNISKWIAGDTTPRLLTRRLAVSRIRDLLLSSHPEAAHA